MDNNTISNDTHTAHVHKKSSMQHSSRHLVARSKIWGTLTALLLLTLLFVCTTVFSHSTRSFASPADVTVTPSPTSTDTTTPSPSPTVEATPTQVPTATPTVAATPRPTPRPQPTATPMPTVGVTATVGVVPTVTPIQKAAGAPPPSPTKQPTPTATTLPTPPPAATASITSAKKSIAATSHQDSVPVMPLVVGTLLTLCLCGVGLVGFRRARTALMPAVASNKSKNIHTGRPWQRVRTEPQPIAPSPTTVPYTPLPESPVLFDPQLEGPRTGAIRRLAPVRLQSIDKPVENWEKEVQ